jgi:hypothetical protein
MRLFKRNHRVAVILFSFLFFVPISFLHATEYYAFRLTGSDCILCHTNPQNGSLNETGILFQQRGYQYPLTWKGSLLYGLWGLPLFLILLGFLRRYRLWFLGKVEGKWSRWKERWKGLFLYGLGHRTVLRSPFPGISHLLLFWSFMLLGLATLTIIIHEYFFLELLEIRFIDSETYPYLRFFLDFFGGIGWAGTILLAYRRYLQRPKELDNQWTDALSLTLLSLVFFTGFSVTGIRNYLSQSPFSSWAPIASTLALIWGDGRSRGKSLENHFYDPLVDPSSSLFFSIFLCLFLKAPSSLFLSPQYLLQKFGAQGSFVQDRSRGFRELRGCKD